MNSKYYVAAITAFTIWGLFSLALKPLSDYSSVDILIYRMSFASAFILILSLIIQWKQTLKNVQAFQHLTKKDQHQIIWVNLASACLLALNWYLFIYVMNHVSVNATSLAYLICPILTTVLAFIFLKERLSSVQKFAILLSGISCIMLSIGHFMDLVYSMIIALSYAIYLILQKKNNQLDKLFTLTGQIVLGSLILSPLFALESESNIEKSGFFYGMVILIAILFTIIPMYLNVFSLKKLNSSVVGVFININPILSFLLAVFYFHEKVSLLQGAAYFLIFFSVVLFNWDVIKLKFIKQKAR